MNPDDEVIPGVKWGRQDCILTSYYWKCRVEHWEEDNGVFENRSQESLLQEVIYCLIGGFGIKAEVAHSFYRSFVENLSLDDFTQEQAFEILNTPTLSLGTYKRYRFPKQRAKQLYLAKEKMKTLEFNTSNHVEFRNQLTKLNGIGYKIASWITRNFLGSDEVAVLDVHIVRAGQHINLFDKDAKLPRDYLKMERRFVDFAKALDVRTSSLDAVMWDDMRRVGLWIINGQKENG